MVEAEKLHLYEKQDVARSQADMEGYQFGLL